MEIATVQKAHWDAVKARYLEAFPKRERKPFFVLRRSVRRGAVQLLTAVEGETLLGFAAVIPHRDMVMVDYLAVSGQVRSRGTGSRLMEAVCSRFPGQRVVLLIERLDDGAENREQRIARRRFYLKNSFQPTGIFIAGAGGDMEIMSHGSPVSPEDYLELQAHALGPVLFRLSGIKVVS